MIKLKTNLSDIKASNLVFLIEKKSDLKLLDSLKLDEKIINKVEKTIKLEENSCIDLFLWDNKFESLFIIYFNKSNSKTLIEFLWEKLSKLPNELTLLSNNDNNIDDLISTTLLSRYKFNK